LCLLREGSFLLKPRIKASSKMTERHSSFAELSFFGGFSSFHFIAPSSSRQTSEIPSYSSSTLR